MQFKGCKEAPPIKGSGTQSNCLLSCPPTGCTGPYYWETCCCPKSTQSCLLMHFLFFTLENNWLIFLSPKNIFAICVNATIFLMPCPTSPLPFSSTWTALNMIQLVSALMMMTAFCHNRSDKPIAVRLSLNVASHPQIFNLVNHHQHIRKLPIQIHQRGFLLLL